MPPLSVIRPPGRLPAAGTGPRPLPHPLLKTLFYWQCFMLSDEARFDAGGLADMPAASVLEQAGMRITGAAGRETWEKTNAPGTTVEADLSDLPLAALPFTWVCAANGIQADIRGLNALVDFDGADLVSGLQRACYRFGILTDFCDRSKLKVYGLRALKKPDRPYDTSGNDLLALYLVPLALRLGALELMLGESFNEKHGPLLARAGFKLD